MFFSHNIKKKHNQKGGKESLFVAREENQKGKGKASNEGCDSKDG